MNSLLSCFICHDCDPRLRFFHVPNESDRLQQWRDILNLEIKTSSIVCEKHFLDEHFTKNLALNCWRINSKAIPILHLSDGCDSDVKFVNEDDFDNNDACAGKKSKDITACALNCLWCEESFPNPNIYIILMHICKKHKEELESFIAAAEYEITAPETAYHELEEDELNAADYTDMEESCDIIETDMETNIMYENSSIKSDNLTDDENDAEMLFEIEECIIGNAYNHEEEDQGVGNTDDMFKIHKGTETANKMLSAGESVNNEINMETSDPELIFYIIDLLISVPTLWFINCFKSKEYESGFNDFCEKFAEKYEYFMTQTELHDSLIELRDWYMKHHEAKTYEQLTCPQKKYFQILAEFLPDKLDGKTCELCGECYSDHIQYFAHKKLKHAMDDECVDVAVENKALSALNFLKLKPKDYFYARYPLWRKFSYICEICTKNDQRPSRWTKVYFYDHIKAHLDIRDLICDVCGKTFVQLKLLQIHRNRHLGKHRFLCKICGKNTFTNGSLLTAHRKRYHRPIEGTIEEIEALTKLRKIFGPRTYEQSQMFEHRIIDGNKAYACRYCDKTYKYRSGVFKHFKCTHPDIKIKKLRSGPGKKHKQKQ